MQTAVSKPARIKPPPEHFGLTLTFFLAVQGLQACTLCVVLFLISLANGDTTSEAVIAAMQATAGGLLALVMTGYPIAAILIASRRERSHAPWLHGGFTFAFMFGFGAILFPVIWIAIAAFATASVGMLAFIWLRPFIRQPPPTP